MPSRLNTTETPTMPNNTVEDKVRNKKQLKSNLFRQRSMAINQIIGVRFPAGMM